MLQDIIYSNLYLKRKSKELEKKGQVHFHGVDSDFREKKEQASLIYKTGPPFFLQSSIFRKRGTKPVPSSEVTWSFHSVSGREK